MSASSPPFSGRSSGVGWTIVLLIMVPLLYLLAFHPVALLIAKPENDSPPPAWLVAGGRPYEWLYNNVPFLRTPIETYTMWWTVRLSKPVPTYIDQPPPPDKFFPRDLRPAP
jgi:hypothetical protein